MEESVKDEALKSGKLKLTKDTVSDCVCVSVYVYLSPLCVRHSTSN